MPVLVRYCFTAIWPLFLLATGTILFVFNLLFYLREFLDYLLVHHAGVINSFLLLLYIQPGFLILAMPVGFLTAIMIVYGRLNADREIVAVESCGFSIAILIWPMVVLSIFLSIFLVFFWDISLPWGNTSFLKLQYKIISERSTIIVRERTFIKDFQGYVLYAGAKDDNLDILKNVTVQLLDQKGYPYRLIVAKTGKMQQDSKNFHIIMDLSDGVMQQIGTPKSQLQDEFFQMRFKSCALDLTANRLKGGPIDFRDPRNVSIKELAAEIEEQKKQKKDNRYYEIEFYKKFSMPFSALAFALFGIPLSLVVRAGSFTGLFLAVVLVVVYWLFDMFGEFGPLSVISPFWAMWLPNVLLALIGLVLIHRLNHKHDFWKSIFRKIRLIKNPSVYPVSKLVFNEKK